MKCCDIEALVDNDNFIEFSVQCIPLRTVTSNILSHSTKYFVQEAEFFYLDVPAILIVTTPPVT